MRNRHYKIRHGSSKASAAPSPEHLSPAVATSLTPSKDNAKPRGQRPKSLNVPTEEDNSAMFELVERMQQSRLDDQRCELTLCHITPPEASSISMLDQMLQSSGPYPQIVLPTGGDYWGQGLSPLTDEAMERLSLPPCPTAPLEVDSSVTYYRQHFIGKEHFNYLAQDEVEGGLVLSVKYEHTDSKNAGERVRAILRSATETVHGVHTLPAGGDSWIPHQVAKNLNENITTEKYFPVVYPRASSHIVQFDEHTMQMTHKFGVILQRLGQTTEEQVFSNLKGSTLYDDFLELLGHRVQLQGFHGYRGGLDTTHNQTGLESITAQFEGHDVMYHVSTLLPFDPSDLQQLQRKRHIGNDVVAVVFQEENTPFNPTMVASHFLHAFIIVQPIAGGKRYRVCVSARSGVPDFGPPLPNPPVFEKGQEFLRWLLTKLVNAEVACFKASRFEELRSRTRCELLKALHSELLTRSAPYLPFLERNESNVLSTVKRVIAVWKNGANGKKGGLRLTDLLTPTPTSPGSLSPRSRKRRSGHETPTPDTDKASLKSGPESPSTLPPSVLRRTTISTSSSYTSLEDVGSSINTSREHDSDTGNESLCSRGRASPTHPTDTVKPESDSHKDISESLPAISEKQMIQSTENNNSTAHVA